MNWDPALYLQFEHERARPFHDLLAQVPERAYATVVDAGCGPGHLTLLLAARWPAAEVLGFDSSPEMIAEAQGGGHPKNVAFHRDDVMTWNMEPVPDLLICNAVLQWAPDHLPLVRRWVSRLKPGGVLAIQVPANLDAPHHVLLTSLRLSARWRAQLGEGAHRSLVVPGIEEYLEAAAQPSIHVNAWETTYQHIINGPDAVLRWVSGTALRPVLGMLPAADEAEFLAEYGALLRIAYPEHPFGTPFPFRRRFLVASTTAE